MERQRSAISRLNTPEIHALKPDLLKHVYQAKVSDMNAKTLFSFFCVSFLLTAATLAQTYSVDWYKIAGGGGTSTGATYQVSSTIGQPDAGIAMTGGNYSLTGGFWSLIAVVQTAGLPNLSIAHSGNSVIISWPNTGSYTLQTNGNLSTSSWIGYGGNISTSNGTNSVTITPPAGNLFFRLKQ
jgi:hypothetical protein